jgi:septum formation protein
MTRRLVLASASPARLRLLRQAGLNPEVLVSGIDESAVIAELVHGVRSPRQAGGARRLPAGTLPAGTLAAGTLAAGTLAAGTLAAGTLAAGTIVEELAVRKARAVAGSIGDALVVGCDSMLEHDGEAFGRPVDAADAVARWHRLRGREATLVTGHAIVDAPSGRLVSGVAATVVRFGRPTDEEIGAYVATGEPLEVAGAFTLDGRSAPFIDGVDGDPGNVIGISLPLLRDLLSQLGVEVTSLWM